MIRGRSVVASVAPMFRIASAFMKVLWDFLFARIKVVPITLRSRCVNHVALPCSNSRSKSRRRNRRWRVVLLGLIRPRWTIRRTVICDRPPKYAHVSGNLNAAGCVIPLSNDISSCRLRDSSCCFALRCSGVFLVVSAVFNYSRFTLILAHLIQTIFQSVSLN
jgi:hypothetical protein